MRTSFFSFLFCLLLSPFLAKGQLVFENTPTGDNMSVVISLPSTPTIGTVPLNSGDLIGAFFTDGSGNLKCSGFTTWTDTIFPPISLAVYKDDNTTPEVDGFSEGDTLIWKVRTISNNNDYDAVATYTTTFPFSDVYSTDGFCQVTNLEILFTPVLGCTDSNFAEYNPQANTDDGSCLTPNVQGCTDSNFVEYNPLATIDDGSCITPKVLGCTDSNYLEYNVNANTDDGSCATLKVFGCTDPNYTEYDSLANVDDGSCLTPDNSGCTDSNYVEYNPMANIDDGSCATLKIYGCMDSNYIEYNPTVNTDDGSCAILKVLGCTDSNYVEYNPQANTDNGSCSVLKVFGCTDSDYLEYNPNANTDDGSCSTLKVFGCTDSNYLEFNSNANVDDGSCVTLKVYGCMDDNYIEYNPAANIDNGSCSTLKVFGCTDSNYIEYNPAANVNDGSCSTIKVLGCTDIAYLEYNPNANVDDGSCSTFRVYGCMDDEAQNYDPTANVEDGSCDYDCPAGQIQIIVNTTTPASPNVSGWFIKVNGLQINGEDDSQITKDTTEVHHFCVEPGDLVLISTEGMVSYDVQVCGNNVPPNASNPNNTGFYASCSIGQDELTHENLNLFPNPVNNELKINAEINIEKYSIFNGLGQKVMEANMNSKDLTINTSQLKSGIYYISLKSKSSIFKQTFIKR